MKEGSVLGAADAQAASFVVMSSAASGDAAGARSDVLELRDDFLELHQASPSGEHQPRKKPFCLCLGTSWFNASAR